MLNDVRVALTEFAEGNWLGSFCFRGAAASSSKGKANGKSSSPQLGERLPEWVELQELFKGVEKGKEEIFIQHGE